MLEASRPSLWKAPSPIERISMMCKETGDMATQNASHSRWEDVRAGSGGLSAPFKRGRLWPVEGERIAKRRLGVIMPVPNTQQCLTCRAAESPSDDELARRIVEARKLQPQNVPFNFVVEICDSYIAKRYLTADFEDGTMRLRLLKLEDKDGIECVQTRIRGQTLMELRAMVQRMRRVTSPTAGSLVTSTLSIDLLDEFWGIPPHAPPAAIPSFLNFWHSFVSFRHESCKTVEEHHEACCGPLVHDPELVFTHTDLAPRNLILEDRTGHLWVVDWDEAGFYPRYFEYAGMHNFYVPEQWAWLARLRWRLFAWLATGSWARESGLLSEAYRKAKKFGASRRFNVKAGASLSERTNID
ncbi:hypothetical protein MAPG_04765 [Magnaporthiopsis poae ATCC 64411]|uniref:Aminoglycoside phosphotransferase domain-containing protein n=1 Tax=Magnaporthiopsis poae (strain ATCC 64411 / 73-15) TaxID=644358 RepID=A0A0C4DXL1_MAGP6|nr:hypothetical protein MAPG_04765 [Magnaporthiopsis poae ATCC 64411]